MNVQEFIEKSIELGASRVEFELYDTMGCTESGCLYRKAMGLVFCDRENLTKVSKHDVAHELRKASGVFRLEAQRYEVEASAYVSSDEFGREPVLNCKKVSGW